MTSLAPPRQARSVATHARLLEATVACLVRHGHAGTTTAAIALEAGVSQGALFKHFPDKGALLGAACTTLLARLITAFRAETSLDDAPDGSLDHRLALGVRALWAVFRRPEMQALFGVYVAARTDQALAADLAPRLEAHRKNILAEARALLPELAPHPDFEAVVDAVVFAMQGVALGLFGDLARDDHRHVAFFERLARRELEHALTSRSP